VGVRQWYQVYYLVSASLRLTNVNIAGKKSRSSSKAVAAGTDHPAPSGTVKARRVRLTDESRICKVKLIVSIILASDTTASVLKLASKG
jgi:hypothetical protein